jgi:hypothetical protein
MTDVDWRHVYHASRMHMKSLASLGQLAGALFGFVVLGIGILLFLVSGQLLVLPFAGLLAAIIAVAFVLRVRRSSSGNPLVIGGKVTQKEEAPAGSSTRKAHYYIQMDVIEAFALDEDGRQHPLAEKQGQQRIRANSQLFGKVHEQEDVRLLCVPTGLAFARLADVLEDADDNEATSAAAVPPPAPAGDEAPPHADKP